MADFGFLSDTDESAVEEILAEAMDHCVLKQVAAINSASFSDSVLPSHLEARFQRLKTFPSSSSSSKPVPKSPTETKHSAQSPNGKEPFSENSSKVPKEETVFEGKSRNGSLSSPSNSWNSSDGHSNSPEIKAKADGGRSKNEKLPSGYVSSPSNSSSSSTGHLSSSRIKAKSECSKGKEGKFPPGFVSSLPGYSNFSSGHLNSSKIKAKSGDLKAKEGKLRSGSLSFRSNSSNSSTETAKSGCFWCTPKRVSRKKSSETSRVTEMGRDWGEDDEILSDLKTFSAKEQKKMMKKAMEEEEKINREAEKIVKWAKQASARFDFPDIDDDELSDGDFGRH